MRSGLCGLLMSGAAALLVGCGASVDGGSGTFVGNADLGIAIAADGNSATPGTNSTWTVTINNAGPQPAADVPVTVALDGTGLLADDIWWTCTAGAGGSCADTLGYGPAETSVSLPAGASAILDVHAPVRYDADGSLSAAATVGEDGSWPDEALANNSADVTLDVGAPPARVDFRDEIIYWAFTDRFNNGDAANDDGNGDRSGDAADPSDAIAWHGGDFAGIREKIEEGYFQGMGFTAIWISPVVLQVPALGNGNAAYHGYWPEHGSLIEPHFGTPADLTALVDAAHANDLKIIMDVVVNHVGFDADIVTTEPDWVRTAGECGSDDRTLCLGGLPDLVQENPEVEQYLLETVGALLADSGVDGVRWDAMKHVNTSFWTAVLAPGAAADRSMLWSVGEVFETAPAPIAFYLDGVGAPSVFDFPLMQALQDSLTGKGLSSRLAQTLAQDSTYSDPSRLSTFLDNHDLPRWISTSIEGAGRPRGEALERLDMALSFLYANRGIPVVYYGTEIGLEGLGDPFSFRDGNSNREDMDFAAAGDPAVSTCVLDDQGLDNAAAFGAEVFVRGSFNDWGTPPASMLVNFGEGQYAAAFEAAAGPYEFKIATADFTLERTADGEVALDTPAILAPSGGNTQLALAQDGCFRFALDVAASTDNPSLTVSRLDTAAPLVGRLKALADARATYAALRAGEQSVLYHFGEQCAIGAATDADDDAFGSRVFVRGSFSDWAHPPAESDAFAATAADRLEALVALPAGEHAYKIATADWSVERVVVGRPTLLDTTQLLGLPSDNGAITVGTAGCYRWTIDITDPEVATLVISEEPAGGDVFALRRDLAGEPSVVLVLNNGDAQADLAALGGIAVDGFVDGAPVEITGRSNDLTVAGGTLSGTLPPRTAYLISTQ